MEIKVIFVEDDPATEGIVNESVEGAIMFTKKGPILLTTRDNHPRLRKWAEDNAERVARDLEPYHQIGGVSEFELAGGTNGR